MEYIELGSAPAEEDCAQFGDPDYYQNVNKECQRYKKFLQYLFPIPEHIDCRFGIRAFNYDNEGMYYEVVIYYNENDEDDLNFAFNVENNLPVNWSVEYEEMIPNEV